MSDPHRTQFSAAAWRTGVALVALLPAVLGAQRSVSGVVFDSLAGRPLAGATVELIAGLDATGRVRSATTDSAGSYRVGDVPAGTYVITFVHDRLDVLGLAQPARRLDVPDESSALRADLAIASASTLARALCGPRTDSAGAIAGRVLDATSGQPAPRGSVTARWAELVVDRKGIRLVPRGVRVDTDRDGRFAICDLPYDVAVRVRAQSDSASSGEIELRVPREALLHRELFVPIGAGTTVAVIAAARGSARLEGHARRDNGLPLAGVHVRVTDTRDSTLTSESGAFALDSLPAGTRTVELTALGFAPAQVAVDLRSGSTASADVTMSTRVAVLDQVNVYGRSALKGEAADFRRRSREMFGSFITPEQIAQRHPNRVTDLLTVMHGLHVTYGPGGEAMLLSSRGDTGHGICKPDVFLDGVWVTDGAESIDDVVNADNITAVEVYLDLGTVPVQFIRGNCGVVVLWTRTVVS